MPILVLIVTKDYLMAILAESTNPRFIFNSYLTLTIGIILLIYRLIHIFYDIKIRNYKKELSNCLEIISKDPFAIFEDTYNKK